MENYRINTSIKKLLLNMLHQILSMVHPFITRPYVSRILGPDEIGYRLWKANSGVKHSKYINFQKKTECQQTRQLLKDMSKDKSSTKKEIKNKKTWPVCLHCKAKQKSIIDVVRVYGTHSIECIYRGDSDDRFMKRVGVYLDEIVGTTLNRLMQYHKITQSTV